MHSSFAYFLFVATYLFILFFIEIDRIITTDGKILVDTSNKAQAQTFYTSLLHHWEFLLGLTFSLSYFLQLYF